MRHIKDAYYFSHDSNAKDDPKCVLLIEQLGLEGYGIFWVLIEILREQPNFQYPLRLIPSIARKYNTTVEKVKTVIIGYELFLIQDDKIFLSESLNRRMSIFLEKREKLSQAGKKGAQIKKDRNRNIAQASLKQCLNLLEASKENENKGNKNLFSKEIVKENHKIPSDGNNRNYEGLVRRLQELKISQDLCEEVIQLTNYGEIGHPIWKFLDTIRDRQGGKNSINDPSAYIKKCLEL